MKISIIGAGFYGCYLATILSEQHEIDIYESKPKICVGSVVNNQNRLHLGYHYPRSIDTIYQIISSYNRFIENFGDCVSYVPQNIYAIHEDSKIDYKSYKKIFDDYGLVHNEVSKSDDIWKKIKNPKHFEGALNTLEGVLDVEKLRLRVTEPLYFNNKVKIFCNYTIDSNNIESLKNQYDYVINCTYNDPFIGFKNTPIEIKKEQCIIVMMKDSNYCNFAFTIMDGDFCSLYPIKDDLFSLSSVSNTPFSKNQKSSFELKSVLEKIVFDNERYFYFKERKIVDYYFGVKSKIKNDLADERETHVFKEENLISVLAGKVSTVMFSVDKVKNEIYK